MVTPLNSWHVLSIGTILLPLLIFLGGLLYQWKWKKSASKFIAGIVLFALITSSPLHAAGLNGIFSAHMSVHVVLLLLVGPLLLMGIPSNSVFWDFNSIKRFSVIIRQKPWISWLVGVGCMWIWHIPSIFHWMQGSSILAAWIRPLQTISLVFAGMFYTFPILHPKQEYKLEAPAAVLYLFTACVGCSLLGLLITFAPQGLYSPYGSAAEYSLWGITPAQDQQAAGLIMWVPCCMIYLSYSMYLLYQWLNESDDISATARLTKNG